MVSTLPRSSPSLRALSPPFLAGLPPPFLFLDVGVDLTDLVQRADTSGRTTWCP